MEGYKEKNHDTLAHSLKKLSAYEVPAQLWMEIEASLDQKEKLQTAIDELPMYQPPIQIWENINVALDQQQVRPSVYRRLRRSPVWMTAAAALAGIALGVWWLVTSTNPEITSISYHQEVQNATTVEKDWKKEEETFRLVLQKAVDSPISDKKTVSQLTMEYDELVAARDEVELMMKRYGTDDQLLKEVARIERERSKVIKQLASWI